MYLYVFVYICMSCIFYASSVDCKKERIKAHKAKNQNEKKRRKAKRKCKGKQKKKVLFYLFTFFLVFFRFYVNKREPTSSYGIIYAEIVNIFDSLFVFRMLEF